MTRYAQAPAVHRATVRDYTGDGNGAYSKPSESPHGFGYCKTPHPIQRETILYRGYCPLCCANGAGCEDEEIGD